MPETIWATYESLSLLQSMSSLSPEKTANVPLQAVCSGRSTITLLSAICMPSLICTKHSTLLTAKSVIDAACLPGVFKGMLCS